MEGSWDSVGCLKYFLSLSFSYFIEKGRSLLLFFTQRNACTSLPGQLLFKVKRRILYVLWSENAHVIKPCRLRVTGLCCWVLIGWIQRLVLMNYTACVKALKSCSSPAVQCHYPQQHLAHKAIKVFERVGSAL